MKKINKHGLKMRGLKAASGETKDYGCYKGGFFKMLKTNSKQARANIRAYILDNFAPENYTDTPPQGFPHVAAFILDTFRSEKYHLPQDVQYYHGCERAAFRDWCAGLPSVMDTCYFYNRSAVDDLGAILDESDAEKARYSESDAEQLLTDLIYNELVRGGDGK